MVHRYSVRPHLLDENAIRSAIYKAGFQPHQRGQIVEHLVEHYTVDLDLLATTFSSLGHMTSRHAELPHAA